MNRDIFIREDMSINDTLKRLDITSTKVLIIVDDDERLLGTVTDGDIRRYILENGNLDGDINEVYNKMPIYLIERNIIMARELMLHHKIELIPVTDRYAKVVDVLTWDVVFSEDKTPPIVRKTIDIPVVIMAGGKGRRLEPFTKILPKPLIPIGDRPILEIIFDEFMPFGIKQYFLTLNYKGGLIEAYCNNNMGRNYNIECVWEEDYMGTAGSLKLLEDKILDLFIVSNCDVIVKADFSEVVEIHKSRGAVVTILSSIKQFSIPYGVVNFKDERLVTGITEKPEYTFTVTITGFIPRPITSSVIFNMLVKFIIDPESSMRIKTESIELFLP
ncbi:MAG: NTP transferase domain-containing protein [Nitrospirae bacterium]|nr:NTP transferase domain-containing protein [Nitrospirota bacterium]